MMEKNRGEGELRPELSYGAGPFNMMPDETGHYHSVDDRGIDHDWQENPFDDEPAEQTADVSEPLAASEATDGDKED